MITSISEGTGLHRLGPGARNLRKRGGTVEGIVTIVAGSANGGGLLQAIEVLSKGYAIAKPGSHATGAYFYVAEGKESALVIIGPPSLAEKPEPDLHESAVLLELDLNDKASASLLKGLRAQFDALLAEKELCRPLTDDYVPDLVAAADAAVDSPPPRRATGELTGISGFYKRLSRNDVSLTDSPGQMIIPRQFLSFFDELNIKRDRSAGGGPRQRHREFSLTYIDGDEEIEVDTARVVLYVPGAEHARRNPEMRFTFRDRDILEALNEADVLEFRRGRGGKISVTRHGPDWAAPDGSTDVRYGEL